MEREGGSGREGAAAMVGKRRVWRLTRLYDRVSLGQLDRGPGARALTCANLVSLRQLDLRRSMVWSRQTRGASGHDTEKKDT